MRPLPLLLALLAAPALAQPLAISSPNSEYDGYFGDAVSSVPDADGDGWGDFVVGATYEDVGGASAAGRAYLYSGATGTLLHTFESPNVGSRFGKSVSGVADADGDGRGDLLVAASWESAQGEQNAGRAYAFSGATGALLLTLESPNPQVQAFFGQSVSGVPDVDGDGRGDLLVGESAHISWGDRSQRVYLFSGATGALLHTLVSPNPESGGQFGIAVVGVADSDGDGRGDLLVGAPEEDGGAEGAGRAYLFSGATGELLRTLSSPEPERLGHFGVSVSGVEDTDGDGWDEFLIGTYEGRAYLYSGATGGLLHTFESPDPAGGFGGPVSGVSDVDGDGRGDVGVGAPGEGVGDVINAGRAYVFSGATGALLFALESPNTQSIPWLGQWFGAAGAGIGDVNGDGRGDGVVGAPREEVEGDDLAGRVYLYRTRGAGGSWVAEEAVAAEAPSERPTTFALSAVPNPLTSGTAIRLALPRPAEVAVEVLNVLGRRVALVHEGALGAGTHALRWAPPAGLPGGVYLLRLRVAGESALTARVTLAR